MQIDKASSNGLGHHPAVDAAGNGGQPAAVWQEQQQSLRVKIHAERVLQGLMSLASNGPAPAEADLLDLSFTSHRRVAGPFVIAVKRLLHRLMTPILTKQIEFNRSLVATLHAQAVAASRVVDECAVLRVAVEDAVAAHSSAEAAHAELRRSLGEARDGAAKAHDQIGRLEGVVAKQRGELEALRRAFGELRDFVASGADASARATATSTETAETVSLMGRQLDEMRRHLDEMASTGAAVQQARTAELDAIRRHLNDLTAAFEGARDRLDELARSTRNEDLEPLRNQLRSLDAAFEGACARLVELDGRTSRLDELDARARRLEEDTDRAMRYVRRVRAAAQAGSTDPGLPQTASPPATVASMDVGDFDYSGFEARFRGSPDTIAERQRDYLRYFRGGGDVLDIGCGRGEFLSLLVAEGISASGIDADLDAVLYCQERGLPVRRVDAFEDLAARPDQSLGGVFLAQVIEHLPTAQAIDLVGRVYEKLRIGGVFVVETLNPESYAVLARWFLLDPTHVRLVHPETLRFILESKGFRVGPCEYRQPVPESEQIPKLALAGASSGELDAFNGGIARVNKMLYGPLDYYLVARRV